MIELIAGDVAFVKSNFHVFDSLSLCEHLTQIFDVVDGIHGQIDDCFLQIFELRYCPEDEVDLGFFKIVVFEVKIEPFEGQSHQTVAEIFNDFTHVIMSIFQIKDFAFFW